VTATEEYKKAQETKVPCFGCEECGKEEGLFSNQHGGIYLCSKCFFKTPTGERWPTPHPKEEDDVETRERLKLAEKVLLWIEKNADQEEKIKKAIQKYREKVHGD